MRHLLNIVHMTVTNLRGVAPAHVGAHGVVLHIAEELAVATELHDEQTFVLCKYIICAEKVVLQKRAHPLELDAKVLDDVRVVQIFDLVPLVPRLLLNLLALFWIHKKILTHV